MKPWENPPVRTTHVTDPVNGKRFTIADYRGSQNLPKRPLALHCDYCCAESTRFWCRRTRGFGVEIFPNHHYVYDGGHWCSCAACESFIAARDLDGLVRRALRVEPYVAKLPFPSLRLLHSIVFSSFEDGDPVIWSSGDEYPVKRAL